MKKLFYLILFLSMSAVCQELDNYGTPTHSNINNTVGTIIQDQVGPANIISYKEAAERININNDQDGVYLLGDQAYLLFDYNNDGKMDLIGWLQNTTPCNDCAGYVTGFGKWVWWEDYFNENTQPTYYDSGIWYSARLEAGDFNGDGLVDVIFENENRHDNGEGGYYTEEHYPLVLLEFSSAGMTEREIGPPTSAHSLATGDIDNDGDIDIIEAEWQYDSCDHISTPKFYMNDGTGNFTVSKANLIESATFLQTEDCTDMAFTYVDLFDFNNDGYLDLIAGYSDGNTIEDGLQDMYDSIGYNPDFLYIMYGDGSGDFSLQNSFTYDFTTPELENCDGCKEILLGGNFIDYNNDGFYDLVTVSTYNYAGVGINILKNINGTNFIDVTNDIVTDPIQLYSESNGPFTSLKIGDLGIFYEVRIIDIDNDGDFDIMPQFTSTVNSNSTTRTAYWENEGGVFSLIKFDEPISDVSIHNVVNNWFSNTSSVLNTYGDIKDWDVSNVTNMYQLFHPMTDFDEDISNWDISNVKNMSMIFHSSGLSTTNYDHILNGWAQQTVQPNVELGAGTIHYCNSGAARESLINNHNWNIVDLGLNCSTASLEEGNKLNISIYPNPVNETLTVTGNINKLTATIYNVLGQVIIVQKITNTLDLSNLSKGNYIIKLNNDKNFIIKKILKE